MKVIDLSHTIRGDMQVYPGDPSPTIDRLFTVKKDGCNVTSLSFGTHTGTHIDVPFHYLEDGLKVKDVEVSTFIGKGILIDMTHKKFNEEINEQDLKHFVEDIKGAEFIIFKTGMYKYYGNKEYFLQPYLSSKCADLIVELGVKIVGIDAASVDSISKGEYPIHQIFLGSNVLIVENLTNLDSIKEKYGIYSFLPLKVDADGSPVRAVVLMGI